MCSVKDAVDTLVPAAAPLRPLLHLLLHPLLHPLLHQLRLLLLLLLHLQPLLLINQKYIIAFSSATCRCDSRTSRRVSAISRFSMLTLPMNI